jgi:hypothetical protein
MNPISQLSAARRLRFARTRVVLRLHARRVGTAASAATVGPGARASSLLYHQASRLPSSTRGARPAACAAPGGKRDACDTAGPEACATARTDSAKTLHFVPKLLGGVLGTARRGGASTASELREIAQSFPKVPRSDHRLAKNRVYALQKLHQCGFARSRRPAGQVGENVTIRPEIRSTSPDHAGVGGATGSSSLPETAQSFPKVSRFDHRTDENRVPAFHKLQKSDRGALRVSRLVRRGSRVASARPALFLAPACSLPGLHSALTP